MPELQQIAEYQCAEDEYEYRGKVAELSTAPLTVAALKGLLTPILEDTVNYVNAPVIAQERGIGVDESKNRDAPRREKFFLRLEQEDCLLHRWHTG